MKMITEDGLNKVAEAVYDLLDEAVVTIDGTDKTFSFYGLTRDDNEVVVSVLLPQEEEGDVTHPKLMDTDGDVFAERQEDFEKKEGKTHLLLFKFTLLEEVVE